MAGSVAYQLAGYGQIEPAWVQDCFHLFKQHQVNIRKLLLLKDSHPDCFAMLEVQFVLSPEQEGLFIKPLKSCLDRLPCERKTLSPIAR